jgi:YHS domain-containing protein
MLAIPLFLLALSGPVPHDVALSGLDPVELCEGRETGGREDLVVTWGRHTYRFSSAENRDRFLAAPEHWGIQWGGGCGRMGPLSGAGSPDRWTVHDGRIYVFASDGCRDGFLADPALFVPAPEPETTPDPAALEEGRRWIERAVEAHGGAEALAAARVLSFSSDSETGGWTVRRELVLTADGALRRRTRWTPPAESGGDVIDSLWVLSEDSFLAEDGHVIDLVSPAQRVDLLRHAYREPLALLWARGRSDFRAVHRGERRLGELEVVDLDVRAAGLATTLHLDPPSGAVVGLSWRGRPADGSTRDVVETFTDWRTVDGLEVPTARRVVVDGESKENLGHTWQVVEVLDAAGAAFRRP